MPVYVGPMRRHDFMNRCLMIADTQEELDAMADAIGIDRKYRDGKDCPRYNLILRTRVQAISLGAIDSNEEFRRCRERWQAAKTVRFHPEARP